MIMKISDLVTVEPVKTMFGKRTGHFKASITGTGLDVHAETKEAALAKLHRVLELADRYCQFRRYYHTKSGEVLCLFHTLGGWQYDISRASDTRNYAGGCLLGEITQAQAVEKVESHVAQYNADFENQKVA